MVAHLAETGHKVDNDNLQFPHWLPASREQSVRQRQLGIGMRSGANQTAQSITECTRDNALQQF